MFFKYLVAHPAKVKPANRSRDRTYILANRPAERDERTQTPMSIPMLTVMYREMLHLLRCGRAPPVSNRHMRQGHLIAGPLSPAAQKRRECGKVPVRPAGPDSPRLSGKRQRGRRSAALPLPQSSDRLRWPFSVLRILFRCLPGCGVQFPMSWCRFPLTSKGVGIAETVVLPTPAR